MCIFEISDIMFLTDQKLEISLHKFQYQSLYFVLN